jgi:nucleotide-binding universal stress UspA family protein
MQLSEGAPIIERVLCALDVEHPILGAVSLAGLIATRFGVPLEVLHVEASAGARGFQSNANQVAKLMATHNAGQRLEQLIEGRGGPESTTTRLALGSPVASILERSALSGNDLIVLGARQRSDLGWQFRTDIARQVSALAECATLTAHDRDQPDKIERILVPVDLGAVTARAIAWAQVFAQRFAAEVHVLHVVSRERRSERSQHVGRASSVAADVGARVAELSDGLTRSGVQATSDVVIARSVVSGITDCNARGEFDLLVLGLSGPPGGAPRLTRGVAATLRNRTTIPVLSVRQTTDDSPNSASGVGSR